MKKDASQGKLAYRVDEVCRLAGVDAETLAAWEEEFPFLSPGLTGTGERYYRQRDVAIIARIRELIAAENLTRAGVKRRIEDEFGLGRSSFVPPEKLRRTLSAVRDELQDIVSDLERGRKKRP